MTRPESDIIRLLTDYSSDESWMNRQLGAQLAASQNHTQLERLLCRLLRDRVEWVRYHAFQALIRLEIPPSRLVPVAKAVSNDPFFRVRQAAANYLEDTLREYMARKNEGPQSSEIPQQPSSPPVDIHDK